MAELFVFVIILALLSLFVRFILACIYKKSAYYEVTHKPLFRVLRDAGALGELLTYLELRAFEKLGARFLFNVYIPKRDADANSGGTSEIDLLMISKRGLFVFESKNYSGWIFGDADAQSWCQILPRGRSKSSKEKFYNPIKQNASHIRHLRAFLDGDTPTHSIVVFSNRCELKRVSLEGSDATVVKREHVMSALTDIYSRESDKLSDADITRIYEKLYPQTQLDEEKKQRHVEEIRAYKSHADAKSAACKRDDTSVIGESSAAERHSANDEPHASERCQDVTSCDAAKSSVEKAATAAKTYDSAESSTKIAPTAESADDPICPRCGSPLVLRTATRGRNSGGQFWGCSAFPKCRYTKPTDGAVSD